MDPIIRLKEVAVQLGVSPHTIRKWIQKGHIARPLKIGPRAVGWRQSYLNEFLAQRPISE